MCSGVGYIIVFHGSTLLAACERLPLVASVTGGPGAPYFGVRLGSGKRCDLGQFLLQPVKEPLWAGVGSLVSPSLPVSCPI